MAPKPAFDVIVCGSLHLDIVVRAHVLPGIDETAVGSGWKQVCGGKGGNQAVQASRAGARTAMIGCIGADEFGQTLRTNLINEGVDVSGVSVDPDAGSGMSVAILQDNGDYGAVIVSGSNTAIDPATLKQQWTSLGGASILILQNEVPHLVNVAAAKAARDAGARVVLNAAPARGLADDLPGLVDVLIVNRVEAEAMFGTRIKDRATARMALSKQARHLHAMIITLGGDGLVVADRQAAIAEFAPLSVEVISTHGAGDCFAGALAAQLALGNSLFESCNIANQSAAAFVSRKI